MTLEGPHYSEMFIFQLGWLHVKQAMQTWNLRVNLSFALGLRKPTENSIDLAGRRMQTVF
jgi:hypothetical protein